jgi:hypothetical protein
MTHEEAAVETEARPNAVRVLEAAFPELRDLPYSVTHAVLHHLDLRTRRVADGGDAMEYVRNNLRPALLAPLAGPTYDFAAVAEYFVAAIHARNLATLIETHDPSAED